MRNVCGLIDFNQAFLIMPIGLILKNNAILSNKEDMADRTNSIFWHSISIKVGYV